MSDTQIRPATAKDSKAITALAHAAFEPSEGPAIAELIQALAAEETAKPMLSLVATRREKVLGHVLFTRVVLEGAANDAEACILAPLAVHPEVQRQGVGSMLVNTGLTLLAGNENDLVFVLGDPRYYGRFGFAAARPQGFEAPHPIKPEYADAWMVKTLRPAIAGSVKGRVRCAGPLNDPKHWSV